MLSKKHAKKPAYLPRFIEQATVPEILKSTCFEGDWLPLQSAAAQLVEHFAPRIPNSLSLSLARSYLRISLCVIYLPTYLPIGLSLSLSFSLFRVFCLSLSLFFPLSLCLSIYPSVFLNCLSVHLSVCIYIYTHTHISMY